MTRETTIPVLPCASVPETLGFYGLLGFEVTHRQVAPYIYIALRRGDIDLHFHGQDGQAQAAGVCLWMVPEVEALHAGFAAALRGAYGRLPIRGLPRITRFRPGQTRFTVVDPTGNSIIVIRHDESARKGERASAGDGPLSRLARALRQAAHARDFKTDDAAAAALLDAALARDDASPPLDRARALLARAELAVALGDPARARSARDELAALPLDEAARAGLQGELQALDELERSQR